MINGKVYAPAKINIGLVVGDKRLDGFHNLDSYFMRISLSDEIWYEIDESNEIAISIEGNESYLELGAVDLMEKAARIVYEAVKKPFSIHLRIEKNIPTKAGLGGGSSDAAAVVVLLSSYFNLSLDDMLSIGESVGSDVPFFITGLSSARVSGRGDVIKEGPLPENKHLLLIFPDEAVSTKDAYAKLDGAKRDVKVLPESLSLVNRELFPNDFELVFEPEIKKRLGEIVGKDDYYSLSGSGSTWFILSNKKRIERYREILEKECQCKVCKIQEY